MAKIGGKCVLAILWLSVRCHPEGGFRSLFIYFHIAGLLRSQNQPVDQITAAAFLKCGQKCTYICAILRNRGYYTVLPTE